MKYIPLLLLVIVASYSTFRAVNATPEQVDYTQRLKVIERGLNEYKWDIKRANARIDESFQNHQFSEDMRDEINLVIKDLHTVIDDNQKRITALEEVKEEVLQPTVEVVVPESPPVKPPVESFAQFAAREYRGVSWIEAGRGEVSVNHLVHVHGWPRNEVTRLSRQQRMRIHGASHSGRVDTLRSRYNATYRLK